MKLKSLNIYFSGEIARPGVQLVHPFSDIFVALIQAGGINIEGSLRKIQLIRDNKIIAVVDLYSFFNNGVNDFSKYAEVPFNQLAPDFSIMGQFMHGEIIVLGSLALVI